MNLLTKGICTPWEVPPREGETIEVAENLHWIRLPLPLKLDHVNIYALDDGDGWSIIDTGMASIKTKAIWDRLLSGPLSGKTVKRVIITHHHPDHIGLLGWFVKNHGAEIWATRTAYLMGRMLTLDVQNTLPQETIAFWRRSGMGPRILKDRIEGKSFSFADAVEHIPLGYRRIQEGDTLKMGGRDWSVHIGNGHAPEHATFWSHTDDLVIAGDQIISSISPNLGVYATEPEADPIGEWLEACERLLSYSCPTHTVFSGHKLPFVGLEFRMRQFIENHHSALERLMAFLETPKKASECFSPLFKRNIGEDEYGLALGEAVAHLNHLYISGRVERLLSDEGSYQYFQIKTHL